MQDFVAAAGPGAGRGAGASKSSIRARRQFRKTAFHLKYGITFPQNEIGTDPIAIRDWAQTVEGTSFDYMIAFDHVTGAHPARFEGHDLGFSSPPYIYEDEFHEPFVLFSYLAGLTKTLNFATSILICRSARRRWWPSRRPRCRCSAAGDSAGRHRHRLELHRIRRAE